MQLILQTMGSVKKRTSTILAGTSGIYKGLSNLKSSINMIVVKPPVYAFKNWDYFLMRLCVYIESDRDFLRVSKVAVATSFMTDEVISCLGVLYVPSGVWNRSFVAWCTAVRDVLRSRDSSIEDVKYPHWHEVLTKKSGLIDFGRAWVERYKEGVLSTSKLWQALETLLIMKYLTELEHRELFWSAHTTSEQGLLSKIAPNFDPKSEISNWFLSCEHVQFCVHIYSGVAELRPQPCADDSDATSTSTGHSGERSDTPPNDWSLIN